DEVLLKPLIFFCCACANVDMASNERVKCFFIVKIKGVK
ncbi:MAG: hypothetical protein JWR54_1623, partial [Mucilaginibacter sp.]|nr:hypothetical protein [Mucilaginibacter sp.]